MRGGLSSDGERLVLGIWIELTITCRGVRGPGILQMSEIPGCIALAFLRASCSSFWDVTGVDSRIDELIIRGIRFR
jgi:hypothetical protein